jgi:alginate O-acetyltransferase complex protein AlgI
LISWKLLLSSSAYFIFLVGIFFLYWPLARFRALALAIILFANYFFYAKWDVVYLALIPAASAIDFFIGLGLQRYKTAGIRRALVTASILMNLGLLAAFKYMPFFLQNIAHLAGTTAPRWKWALPLSLSFYAFQALTYTIDLYRGDAKGTRSFLAHFAAVSFFPTTLAGPITRVSSLIQQFEKRPVLDAADGSRALFLIGVGLMKKFLVADYLSSNFVNRVFDFPNLYTGFETLIAVYAYALQIYYDFSGYTDIALGSALLLGIKLPVNFNRPYSAENIADFWRRWHISLSNWLRDYLFFSLPGKRSKVMPYVSLIITMVLGGLWHGASWNFVIWGALHGVALAIVRFWQTYISPPVKGAAKSTFWKYADTVVTFHFVAFAWIFFRASDFDNAIAILARIGSLTVSAANVSGPLVLVLAVALVGHYLPKKWYDWSVALYVRAPFYAQAAALALLVLGLQNVVQSGSAPFIYTKF